MTAGRKSVLAALALVALSALAAAKGLPFPKADPPYAACSSCDARHQNHLRLMEKRAAETTP